MRFTPQKTLSRLVEGGNDYVVAVKENQGKLYRQIETICRYRQPRQTALMPFESQHGRQEQWVVRTYSAKGLDPQCWLGAKNVLCVERRRCTSDRCSVHQAYYLSSLATTARLWNDMVRGHWSIENQLHWPKDTILHEDKTYGRDSNGLLNASLFRSITINVLRLNGFNSLTAAVRGLANQVEQIFRLLQ
ncbi:ISAs1 family transposase [Nodosilinea nodulosa]|uniref:ISAs1 family transposase n=1 Tax=Nodosilinea nodulosa TaxID=416001 RepID=UPI000360727F|nr:ISAs1 family transposase [Nodosilinea nodulosa]